MYVPSPVTVKRDGGLILPADYRSPPFFGSWENPNPVGMGIKKAPKKRLPQKKAPEKNGQRVASWQKQSIQRHPHPRSIAIRFINKLLSNF